MNMRVIQVIVLVGTVTLVGCESAPSKPSTPSSTDVAPINAEPLPGLTPKQRLRRSFELLENGDQVQARAEVVAYLSVVPNSALAQDVLLQIDTDPTIYFPKEYREIELLANQTLSSVAETYLGSAFEFYALARYNGIERPRRVVPGQVVKVPLTSSAIAVFESGLEEIDVSVGSKTTVLEILDTQTADSDTPSSVETKTSDPGLPELGSDSNSASAVETGIEVDDKGAEVVIESAGTQASNAALDLVAQDSLHRKALNAYRSQDLDTAISLWDELLRSNPDYESAQLYRAQAQALKERLKSLN